MKDTILAYVSQHGPAIAQTKEYALLEGELQREVTNMCHRHHTQSFPPSDLLLPTSPSTSFRCSFPLFHLPLMLSIPPQSTSSPRLHHLFSLSISTIDQVRVLLDAAARRHGCGSRNEGERRFSTCSVM